MKFLTKISLLAMLVVLLAACGGDSEESSTPSVPYTIALEDEAANIEQVMLRVTTEATEQKDFESITENIMKQYEDKGLDSMHIFIHAVDESKDFGEYKAHSFVAYSQLGAAQVGVDGAHSYKIEVE